MSVHKKRLRKSGRLCRKRESTCRSNSKEIRSGYEDCRNDLVLLRFLGRSQKTNCQEKKPRSETIKMWKLAMTKVQTLKKRNVASGTAPNVRTRSSHEIRITKKNKCPGMRVYTGGMTYSLQKWNKQIFKKNPYPRLHTILPSNYSYAWPCNRSENSAFRFLERVFKSVFGEVGICGIAERRFSPERQNGQMMKHQRGLYGLTDAASLRNKFLFVTLIQY